MFDCIQRSARRESEVQQTSRDRKSFHSGDVRPSKGEAGADADERSGWGRDEPRQYVRLFSVVTGRQQGNTSKRMRVFSSRSY